MTENSKNPDLEIVARAAKNQSVSGLPIRISRVWNILKYYRKSQLAIRGLNVVRNRVVGRKPYRPKFEFPADFQYSVFERESQPALKRFAELAEIRKSHSPKSFDDVRSELENDQVTVLNQTWPLVWKKSPERSLLWQFQLHYHEYLLPLIGSDSELIQSTVSSWIAGNKIEDPSSHVDAWHPYCISRRLPVWFCILANEDLEDELKSAMTKSAFDQTNFLSENLEWDLRGNHLLENLRALALAGGFFGASNIDPQIQSAAQAWQKKIGEILPDQIREQVLPWGEHFERCPMYHCQIAGNLLETLIAFEQVDSNVTKRVCQNIRPVATQMLAFLEHIVHPDGEIPLLGDSCFGEAPSVACLFDLAELANLEWSDSNQPAASNPYWTSRDGNNLLIFDRGSAGAQPLPAHAHCDLLTIEASLNGKRMIVDSGLYNYEDDPMRWYCRSSLAHNVVCVADQNQFDVWSKFRMGYRGQPANLKQGEIEDFRWASASHNAFRRHGLPNVFRLVGSQTSETKNQFWYCLDLAKGSKKNIGPLTGMLHFSPETSVIKRDEANFELEIDEYRFALSFFGTTEVKTMPGWYCPQFGVRQENTVLQYAFSPNQPAGWLFWRGPDTNQPSKLTTHQNGNSIEITITDTAQNGIHNFHWNPA